MLKIVSTLTLAYYQYHTVLTKKLRRINGKGVCENEHTKVL